MSLAQAEGTGTDRKKALYATQDTYRILVFSLLYLPAHIYIYERLQSVLQGAFLVVCMGLQMWGAGLLNKGAARMAVIAITLELGLLCVWEFLP